MRGSASPAAVRGRRIILLALLLAASCAAAADPLSRQVTIYRDDHGVPHIVGETEEATFFGYGYAQAQDHLERMMLQYRDAQGRRAEVLGFEALGEGYLHFLPYHYRWDGDYLQRLLGTRKGVAGRAAQMEVYRILDGFARGVNQYIREHRRRLPPWIEPVAAEDIEALERSHYFRFYSIHEALTKLPGPTYSFPSFGSNQFAIAAAKSATGRVIHVEHTHMPWGNRFQNYEAHLMTPGKLNAGGISWFGSPFFLMGFNDRVTWSATWNDPNISDVYEEELHADHPLRYRYDGDWRDIRVEHEVFRVKGPRGLEAVTLPLYFSHHGPIVKIDRERRRAWAVKLPNFEGVNYSAGLYELMKVREARGCRTALARQLIPRWNFLCTDERNLYWVHNALVAKRPEGFDWRKPVPGWTSRTEWGPYLPFDANPFVLNPAAGFVQNTNDPPWVVTRNSGIDPAAPRPYYLRLVVPPNAGEEFLNTRGERLFQVLGQDRRFTIEDMIALAYDTYVMPAEVIVPLLARAVDQAGAVDPEIRSAVAELTRWDRRTGQDSIASTYLHFWGRAYAQMHTPARFARFTSYRRRQIDLASPEEQRAALAALKSALAEIRSKFGKVEVPWGDVMLVRRGGTFRVDGSGMYGVLHIDRGVEQEDGRVDVNDGWGHLLVAAEGDPKRIWSLLPYGQSEDPRSPHYNDQLKLHSERKVKRFWFTPAEILENTVSVWGDRERLSRLRSFFAGEKK